MRKVDLRKKDGGVSPKYLNVSQPMYIFHSKKELKEHITKNELTTFHIIRGVEDFLGFTKKYGLQGRNKFCQVSDVNVFVATGEKFVPKSLASAGVEKGIIHWELDEEGRAIPTDNCFIQLHLILSARNHYLCFFSNGIEMLSISRWNLTAAVKDQFKNPSSVVEGVRERSTYDERLKALLERKRATVRDVRLFHLLFNPLSDTYLKLDDAVKKIYGLTIRKDDREKIVQTKRFRELFRKELAYLMGDLQKAFKTEIPDKEMVEMAKLIFDKSLTDGTTDDSLKVYDAILNIRESDETVSVGESKLIDGAKSPKLIEKNDKKGFAIKKEETEDSIDIELLDDVPAPPEKVVETNEFTILKPPYDLSKEEKKEKVRQLDVLREDVDAVDFDGMSKLSAIDDL